MNMSIGGSAFNGGVHFLSDDFAAKFVMQKDGTPRISVEKRIKTSKVKKFFKRIPLVKGLFSMLTGNRVLPLIVLLSVLSDVTKFDTRIADTPIMLPVMIVSIAGPLLLLIYLIRTTLYNVKETWRYHGAEHKTIYAYESGMDLTLDNVRGCPRVARRCGTNLVVFMLLFCVASAFFIEYDSVKLVGSFVLAYELFDLDNGERLPVIKLFFKLGYWCQEHMFTLEPTDAQIVASIDTIKMLVARQEGHA